MTTITMADARRMIMTHYNNNEPLFLMGKPGMGKSALFEGIARELGIGFIDFRFTQRDPVDIGGMRIPDQKTGRMKHFVPDDLPTNEKEHGKRGLLVFDEINSVGPMLQAVGYGIIQERRVGMTPLLPGWCPMASGNNVGDRASAQRLSTALANRFNVQVVEPDLPSWLEQYGSEHADARGCAFLRFRPELFHKMPTADQTAFPSARSWTKAFKFIDEEPSFRRKIFTGYVGQAAADEFEAFWRILSQAISVDEIVADPAKARLPDEHEPGTYYAVAGMLSRMIDRRNVGKLGAYIKRLLPDYQVMIFQDATRRDPSLKNTSEYGAFAVRNQELLA